VNAAGPRAVLLVMDQRWSKGRQATAFTGAVLLVLGGGTVALGLLGGTAEPVVNLASTQDAPNSFGSPAALGPQVQPYSPSPTTLANASTSPLAQAVAPTAAPGTAPPIGVRAAAKTATATATAKQHTPQPSARPTTPKPAPTTPPPPANKAVTVSGYIECQSQSVEGVWIQASSSDSGWAPFWPSASDPDYATYQYTLGSGGQYAVHVGCGGTQSSWGVATYSDSFSGPTNDFYCYDSGGADYTYCARVGGS